MLCIVYLQSHGELHVCLDNSGDVCTRCSWDYYRKKRREECLKIALIAIRDKSTISIQSLALQLCFWRSTIRLEYLPKLSVSLIIIMVLETWSTGVMEGGGGLTPTMIGIGWLTLVNRSTQCHLYLGCRRNCIFYIIDCKNFGEIEPFNITQEMRHHEVLFQSKISSWSPKMKKEKTKK